MGNPRSIDGKSGFKKTRRSHLVPAFYLRNFTNQSGMLWVLDTKSGKVFQSSPEKVGTIRDYYRGEAERHEDDLEEKLASIESDAAVKVRLLLNGSMDLGSELTRFVAWMASRTEWIKRSYEVFNFKGYLLENFDELCELDSELGGRKLPFSFRSCTGDRVTVPLSVARMQLESPDWQLEMSQDQFLDIVRMQAYLFQTIHFPRLQWVRLVAPVGSRFITSDRPVSRDVLSQGWQNFPAALKHPQVDLIFPVSSNVAIMAGHDQAHLLDSGITPSEFNRRVTLRAERFLYAQARADLADMPIETIH